MQARNADEPGRLSTPEVLVALVAEDDVLIRLAIADFLRNSGFVVLEAASADEARQVFLTAAGIDVVFSDINMPDVRDGIELASWMAMRNPEIPVILTSGHANSGQEADIAACANVTDFLLKPYAFEDVEALCRARVVRRNVSRD